MIERSSELNIDFSRVNETNGNHYVLQVNKIQKKKYAYCAEVIQKAGIFNSGPTWLRCAYSRESSLYKFDHECKFLIKLPDDFRPPDYYIPKMHIALNEVSLLVAQLAVELNISINSAASPMMKNFITKILQKGFLFARNNPSYNYTDIPKIKYSREKISKEIIERARSIESENKMLLDKFEFYSLTLDAGTVINKHGLFYCASNPSMNSEHIYLGCEMMSSDWDASKYKEWGNKMLREHPKLSAFVGDGLRAGIAGLAHYKPNGICHDLFSTVLFISCHSHIVNLAFEHAIEKCDELKKIVEMIENIGILLRKPAVKNFDLRVPFIPKTRWLYSYDIAIWIMKREKKVNEVIRLLVDKEPNVFNEKRFKPFSRGIPDVFHKFIRAAKPLKILQLAYENEKVGLPLVYPFFIYAIEMLNSCISDDDSCIKTIASNLKKNLVSQFREKTRIPIIVLAFALTPIGKQYINGKRFNCIFKPIVDIIIDDIDKDIDTEMIQSEVDDDLMISEDENSETNKFIKPVIENEEYFTRINDSAFDEMFNNSGLDNDLVLDKADLLQMAVETLVNRIEIININFSETKSMDKRKEILEEACDEGHKLHDFLSGITDDKYQGMFSINNNDLYGHAFWTMKYHERIKEQNGEGEVEYSKGYLSTIAMNALQLMSIPAGEASCERAISKCRWITGAHNTNESEEMWAARLLTGIAGSRDYSKAFRNPLEIKSV